MPVYGLLVRAVSNNLPDPVKDARAAYKRGDIVHVYPGAQCTKDPGPNNAHVIVLVNLPLSYERVLKLVSPEFDSFPNPVTGEPVILRKRKWQIRFDDLPLARRQELQTTGKTTITQTRLEECLRHKRLGNLTNLNEVTSD
jgi:hypothetical protein